MPAAWGEGSDSDIEHIDLSVRISPDTRSMEATAALDIKSASEGETMLVLNENMHVESIRADGAEIPFERRGSELRVQAKKGEWRLEAKYRTQSADMLLDGLLVGRIGGPGEASYMIYRSAWYPMIFGDRFTASASIEVPEGYEVASVGDAMDSEQKGTSIIHRWRAEESVPGISFAAGQYAVISRGIVFLDGSSYYADEHHGKKGQHVEISCYLLLRDVPLARNCVERAKEILAYYSSILGGYPFRTLAIVEMQEDFFGGHGTRGLAMVHPRTLRSDSRELLAHEIAHGWWGALVSVKRGYNLQPLMLMTASEDEENVNDLWLHEGLATYSSLLYLERGEGRGAMLDALKEKREEYLSSGNGQAIASAEEQYTTDSYHATVYGKGALVLHMLRYVMGDEAFFRTLVKYKEIYRGKSVTIDDFQGVAAEEYGGDLGWFFDAWVRGNAMPDYEVAEALVEASGEGYRTRITIAQRGSSVAMPLDVTLRTSDGDISRRIFIDASQRVVEFVSRGKPIYVDIDEGRWILESDRSNNVRVIDYPLSLSGMALFIKTILSNLGAEIW